MTREEVLLDIAERCGIDIDGNEYVMVYDRDKMIKFKRWLFKELKNADKEPCEDCVSRKAVIDLVNAECVNLQDGSELWRSCVNDTVESIYQKVKALPSVTPTRKKGKWIVEDSGNYNGKYTNCYCSNCKDYYTRNWKEMKYCPNCGSEMESEE